MAKKINKSDKDVLYTQGIQAIKAHSLPQNCHFTSSTKGFKTVAETVQQRSGFNRHDMDAKRIEDRLPTGHADIILACQAVYRKVGMVRNIIDLMTDFASEGLELQHPTKIQEKFYREWAKRVNLDGRAHDFMKLLMRDANVIVRRKNAVLSKSATKEMTKGDVVGLTTIDETAYPQLPEKIKTIKPSGKPREIPWRYTFLSPILVEKIGGEVGRFFGSDSLGMRIPKSLANAIKSPKTEAEKEFIKKLPPEVIAAAKKSNSLVRLDMDKIYVDYYKKDDWEDWGTPFLFGVLEDVMFKEKMRLADMAALDGVINVIRLWKLGKSDQQILPTAAAVDKLIDILQHNVGGGVMDLVWDDMIDLHVEYPPTDKILGPEKYRGVNADIVRGLGIPDSLIGGEDLGTRNAQSAFVQLKTLVERLEYVRGRAIRWLETELRLVADAMGFKKIPSISFGVMSLRDEAAEKQLMVQLLDRGIISSEKATEVFGVNFMMELERLKNEQALRKDNPGVLEKANPYYRPVSVMEKQTELAIKLEAAKTGLSGDDNGGGDNPLGDQPSDDGDNQSGRPPSTVDTKDRDDRTNPTMSMLQVMAENFMSDIDAFADTAYLKANGVKNIRSLTNDQRTELEAVKRGMLSVLRPGDTVTNDLIKSRLPYARDIARRLNGNLDHLVKCFIKNMDKTPTAKERRILTASAWINLVINKEGK